MGGRRHQPVERIDTLDARFSDRLYDTRRERNLSRRELSEQTGIAVHSIEKMETGHGTGRVGMRRRATIGEAIVLAEALGVKPGDLLRGGESRD
jgi:transcriptional regulator with XRE-family HTH domain